MHGIPSDGTVNIASQAKPTVGSTNPYPTGGTAALNDGVFDLENTDPTKSWNNWSNRDVNKSTVTYTWDSEVPLRKVEAYFWSDGGGVPLPRSWKVQTQNANGEWQDVTLQDGQSYGVAKGAGNAVSFNQVWTKSMRVVFSSAVVGLTELEAYATEPSVIDGVHRMIQSGSKASTVKLPAVVSAVYPDGTRHDLSVKWDEVTDQQLVADGVQSVNGSVIGALVGVKATLNVKSDANSQNTGTAQLVEQVVVAGAASIDLPTYVPVQFPNGAQDDRNVKWDEDSVGSIDLKTVGDYEVTGIAEGSASPAKLIVHVIAGTTMGELPDPGSGLLEGWIESQAISTVVSAEASWSKAEGKLNDGKTIDDTWPSADDQDVNAKVWGSWGQAKDGMYAEYRWKDAVTIDSSRVQFWANFGIRNNAKGGLEVPDEWKLQYLDADGTWREVTNAKTTIIRNSPVNHAKDDAKGWSESTFDKVTTTGLRLVINKVPTSETGSTFGIAVAEWGVHAVKEDSPNPPEQAANKDSLNAAIEAAESLEEKHFTPRTWQHFIDELNNAKSVSENESASQDEINQTVSSLEAAQKALVQKADTTALIEIVAKAEAINTDMFTEESVSVLRKSAEEAAKVLENADSTQQVVDETIKTVSDAIASLVAKQAEPETKPTGNQPVTGPDSQTRGKKGSTIRRLSATGSAISIVAVLALVLTVLGVSLTTVFRRHMHY